MPARTKRIKGEKYREKYIFRRRDPRGYLGAIGGGRGRQNRDFDHDGRVGPGDLLLLRENYGARTARRGAGAGDPPVSSPLKRRIMGESPMPRGRSIAPPCLRGEHFC